MKVLFKYLRLLSLSTSGALLLCIVFAANPEIAEGTITGKVFWFHFSILLLAFSVLFMEATVKKSNFTFSLPDGLFITFCRSGLAKLQLWAEPGTGKTSFRRTNYDLMVYAASHVASPPGTQAFFLSIIICTGIFEAAWGMGQLYGEHRQTIRYSKVTDLFSAPAPSPVIWQSYSPYA